MAVPEVFDITLPCADEASAEKFAEYVRTKSVVRKVEGRFVTIATTDIGAAPFLDMITLHALEQGWTRGIEMALAYADAMEARA